MAQLQPLTYIIQARLRNDQAFRQRMVKTVRQLLQLGLQTKKKELQVRIEPVSVSEPVYRITVTGPVHALTQLKERWQNIKPEVFEPYFTDAILNPAPVHAAFVDSSAPLSMKPKKESNGLNNSNIQEAILSQPTESESRETKLQRILMDVLKELEKYKEENKNLKNQVIELQGEIKKHDEQEQIEVEKRLANLRQDESSRFNSVNG